MNKRQRLPALVIVLVIGCSDADVSNSDGVHSDADPTNVRSTTAQSEDTAANRAERHASRGWELHASGHFDEAIEAYNEAIRLDPDYSVTYSNRGLAWLEKQEFDKAISDHDRAIAVNPNDAAAFSNRGWTWRHMGEYGKAITDFEASMQLDQEDPFPVGNCAWLLATCVDARYRDGPKAVQYATKACELTDWKHESGLATLAVAYAESGMFKEALTAQRRAIELAPDEHQKAYRDRVALFEAGKPYRE